MDYMRFMNNGHCLIQCHSVNIHTCLSCLLWYQPLCHMLCEQHQVILGHPNPGFPTTWLCDFLKIFFNAHLRICLLILEREEGREMERKREKH